MKYFSHKERVLGGVETILKGSGLMFCLHHGFVSFSSIFFITLSKEGENNGRRGIFDVFLITFKSLSIYLSIPRIL